MIRFMVEKLFDWTGKGLMLSGFQMGGIIEPGMRLGNGTGTRATVLRIEPESPRDRQEGWVTLLLESTTPSPAAVGVMLKVEESPTVAYRFHATPDLATADLVTISEATPGTSRAVTIRLSTLERFFAASPPPASQEITREQAEQTLRAARTIIPSEPELRRIMLTPRRT